MFTKLSVGQRIITTAGICTFGLYVSILLGLNPLHHLIWWCFIAYLLTGDRALLIYATIRKLPRDIKAIYILVKMLRRISGWEKDQMTVPRIFLRNVMKTPNKTAFMMDDHRMTFQQVENFSNQVAHYFKTQDIKTGTSVALIMENCPEYPCMWLALSKVGISCALINTNLRHDVLIHSIQAANCSAILIGSELAEALEGIRNADGIKGLPVYEFNRKVYLNPHITNTITIPGARNLNAELQKRSKEPLYDDISRGSPKDILFYIYTSGTTGMPKAAVITHIRFLYFSTASTLVGIKSTDVMYTALPLYHTAGGSFAVSNVFVNGLTLAIRKRFSASNFWSDCIKYNCTVTQYIGELCRYLLATPFKPEEKAHKLRLMVGNGLKPQIWKEFSQRFHIPKIAELYGATESNAVLANIDNHTGAIGFIPPLAAKYFQSQIIRCDNLTGEPIRDAKGFCMRCSQGEPGLFVGKIEEQNVTQRFAGYTNKKDSEKKIIRNVFKEGDAYFNTGDLLVMDAYGYIYFKDRLGDTFRYRGENVSTSEVEAIISNIVGLSDCTVYGVEIPNVEGKGGMAAIVDVGNSIDLVKLTTGLRLKLPSYARPLFIRIIGEAQVTSTFKLRKVDLQKEGFNVTKIKDPIYFLNPDGVYRLLTNEQYDDILSGKTRL